MVEVLIKGKTRKRKERTRKERKRKGIKEGDGGVKEGLCHIMNVLRKMAGFGLLE